MARAPRLIELQAPKGGLFRRLAYQKHQPFTSPELENVWPDDPILERQRIGSRPAYRLSHTTELGSGNPVRLLADVMYVASGVHTPLSIASANGVLYKAAQDATAWTSITSGVTLASNRMLSAADHLQTLWISGNNASPSAICSYTPSTNTLAVISASAGTAPTNVYNLDTWRDRLMACVDVSNPHLWYLSAAGDPTDWDYTATGLGRAVAAANTEAGRLGEPITAGLPLNDDCYMFGSTGSIAVLRGSPAAPSSSIDYVSHKVGVLDRGAITMDPGGNVWFLSRDGLYWMPAGCGQPPVSVSREMLPQELRNIDTSTYTVTMAHDFFNRGLHIYVAKNSADDGTGHFWVDTKQWETGDREAPGAAFFFPMKLQTDHEPFALFELRDTTSSYSHVLAGGRDGKVRRLQSDQHQDDGDNEIVSYAYLGPIALGANGFFEGMLQQLVGVLGADSGDVRWEVYVGNSIEDAYNKAVATAEGRWRVSPRDANMGANAISHPRVRGAAMFIKVRNGENDKRWTLESIHAALAAAGKRRIG